MFRANIYLLNTVYQYDISFVNGFFRTRVWRAASNSIETWRAASNSIETYDTAPVQEYANTPEYCYSATFEEVEAKDFSLVPSKYIEFVNRDENIDFDEKMKALQTEFAQLLKAEEQSKTDLLNVFKELGYKITV